MTMNFVNPSRTYEHTERGVRFWGYDREIEISFIVAEGALSKIDAKTSRDSEGYLKTFDAHRERIHGVADSTYAKRSKGARSYLITLRDADF